MKTFFNIFTLCLFAFKIYADGAIEEHLREALAINTSRLAYYAKASNGLSIPISSRLIFSEAFLLVFSARFDRQARQFQKEGIPLFTEDFVSLKHIKNKENPPTYQQRAPYEKIKELKNIITILDRKCRESLGGYDFTTSTQLMAEVLLHLQRIEEESQSHFAMTAHILESMGFLSLHAISYSEQSHGRSDTLMASVILWHLSALRFAIRIDKKAQALHEKGIGILVNDLPKIPFPPPK